MSGISTEAFVECLPFALGRTSITTLNIPIIAVVRKQYTIPTYLLALPSELIQLESF